MVDSDPNIVSVPAKPGYKTPSFYITLAVTVLTGLVASGVDIAGLGAISFVLGSLTAAGYTAIRTIKKSESAEKPAYKTTEFYLSLVAALVAAAYASGLFVDTSRAGMVLGLVSTVLAALGYTVRLKK